MANNIHLRTPNPSLWSSIINLTTVNYSLTPRKRFSKFVSFFVWNKYFFKIFHFSHFYRNQELQAKSALIKAIVAKIPDFSSIICNLIESLKSYYYQILHVYPKKCLKNTNIIVSIRCIHLNELSLRTGLSYISTYRISHRTAEVIFINAGRFFVIHSFVIDGFYFINFHYKTLNMHASISVWAVKFYFHFPF